MKPSKWEELLPNIQSDFLFGGMIKLEKWFSDDSDASSHAHLYTDDTMEKYFELIKNKQPGPSYGITDIWLYELLEKNVIKNKTCAIMGSITPWYESISLYYGGTPTTFEYNTFVPKSNRLKMVNVSNYFKSSSVEQYDVGISISSFEHDGLGRYGDPMDPFGDFRAMSEMKKLLKKDGLLFIAVPIGIDKLVWNVHRIYGRVRLPYLFDGWEIIDLCGFSESHMDIDTGIGGAHQPVFVLKNI